MRKEKNMNQIDAIGCSCPEPVILTKKSLEANPEGVIVQVDNGIAVENISRFAGNRGYNIEVVKENDIFVLTLKKQA